MNRLQARLGVVAGLGALLAAPLAQAHHSGAMFDHNKVVPLAGTVKDFAWKNPHAWLQVIAPGPAGKTTAWTIECSSINILARKGWTSDSFKPGDKITLTMHPMKDGSAAGFILKADTVDGHSLSDHDY